MIKKDGKSVMNRDIIEKIYELQNGRDIQFVKVAAHQKGDGYLTTHNNIVDKLAKRGASICETKSAKKVNSTVLLNKTNESFT